MRAVRLGSALVWFFSTSAAGAPAAPSAIELRGAWMLVLSDLPAHSVGLEGGIPDAAKTRDRLLEILAPYLRTLRPTAGAAAPAEPDSSGGEER
jgi:hypothetical protein